MSLVYDSAQTVTLSGSVSDIDATGETVTFSGLVSGSAVTDVYGNFSYTTNVSGPGAIYATATDLWGQTSNIAEADVTPAPTVTLNTQILPGHEVELTGNVSGAYAAGATITFSGAANGTATADANGNFTFTTSAASLGAVSAVAVDSQQHASSAASAAISESGPTITLSAQSTSEDYMTFVGTVSDVDEAGETVNISGATKGAVTTDSNGNFSFTMATADLGTVDVSTTDLWGMTSNTAEVAADTLPPEITSFTVVQGANNLWILQGTVVAENPQGMTVTFGGMQVLNGLTTTVAADGTFSIVVTINPNQFGTATAQTSDQNGVSNLAAQVIN